MRLTDLLALGWDLGRAAEHLKCHPLDVVRVAVGLAEGGVLTLTGGVYAPPAWYCREALAKLNGYRYRTRPPGRFQRETA